MDNIIENIIREIEIKNYRKAIEYCDELLLQQPQNENIFEIKAGCYLALKDFKASIDNYQKAIENSNPDRVTVNELALLYEKKGRAHLRINEYENASEEFKKSLNLNPQSPDTHNDFAACLRRLKFYDEALEHSSKAIEMKQDSAEFHNNRGNINFCLGRTEEALKDYDKAIELNPDYANAYFNRGTLFFDSLNNSERAKSDWQKAIELNPAYEKELEQNSVEISELLHTGEVNDTEKPNELKPDISESEKSYELTPDVSESEKPEELIPESTVTEKTEELIPAIFETEKPEELIPESSVTEKTEDFLHDISDEEKTYELIQDTPETEIPDDLTPETSEAEIEPETISGSLHDVAGKEEKFEDIADKISIIPLEPQPTSAANDSEGMSTELPDIHKSFSEPAAEPDIFKSVDLDSGSKLSLSEYFDLFERDKTEVKAEPLQDDIKIPEMDFKSIFNENSSDVESDINEEIMSDKPLLTEEIKDLHSEIEKPPEEAPQLESFSSKFSVFEKDLHEIQNTVPPDIHKHAPKKWYLSPVFYIIIFAVFLIAGLYTAYYFFTKINPVNVVTVNVQDTVKKTEENTADTVKKTEENTADTTAKITEAENTQTAEETNKQSDKTETKEEKPAESRFLGYLSDKKIFALFSEPDGIYVQIGSFKDKSAADERMKLLTSNNIKGSIFKADLGDKGILYRVRAGAFATQEEAKKVMTELEK